MQCMHFKEDGEQCKRRAVPGDKFCWQHKQDFHFDYDEDKELTEMQHAFCEEYLVDLKAKNAAIRAGYSEESAAQIGYRNLNQPHVVKEIERLKAERNKRTQITQDRVLEELAKIGFADINDFLEFRMNARGEPTIELKDSKEVDGSVIEEVKLSNGNLTFKLHNKLTALKKLAEHVGIGDKENSVEVNITNVQESARDKVKQTLDNMADKMVDKDEE